MHQFHVKICLEQPEERLKCPPIESRSAEALRPKPSAPNLGALPLRAQGFSDFSAAQRDAGKHVSLMSELSRQVDTRDLMNVSSVRPKPES